MNEKEVKEAKNLLFDADPRFSIIKDSGKKQVFQTGAQRDMQDGKGRFDLLPCHALTRLAKHFENGAKKYGDSNWRKGIPLHRYLDSAMRHLVKFMDGERDEDHAIAVAWNIMCLVETEAMIMKGQLPAELDTLRHEEPSKISFSEVK